MKSLGRAGSGRPRPVVGDYERALALIVEVGGDKTTKAYIGNLLAAKQAEDAAREAAEAAAADADKRKSEARSAEQAAITARQAFADESALWRSALSARETEVTERERVVDATTQRHEAEAADMKQREAALRRAFDAYQGADG